MKHLTTKLITGNSTSLLVNIWCAVCPIQKEGGSYNILLSGISLIKLVGKICFSGKLVGSCLDSPSIKALINATNKIIIMLQYRVVQVALRKLSNRLPV